MAHCKHVLEATVFPNASIFIARRPTVNAGNIDINKCSVFGEDVTCELKTNPYYDAKEGILTKQRSG